MKGADVFPSRWLAAADLGDREPTVTIDRILMEDISEKDRKPVAYFRGAVKGMIINKTNWKRLEYILKSDESDNWIGKPITLYVELVDMRGEMKPALRVKAPVKGNGGPSHNAQISTGRDATPVNKPPPADDMDQEVPF